VGNFSNLSLPLPYTMAPADLSSAVDPAIAALNSPDLDSDLDYGAIDAVIFDMGGVIIDLDYGQTIAALSALSGLSVGEVGDRYAQHQQDPLFDDFETGRIDAIAFRLGLRNLLDLAPVDQGGCSDAALDEAWNALILHLPPGRIDWLRRLQDQKRTFLLSNNNEIHLRRCDELLRQAAGPDATWSDLFERVYLSHQCRDRKPHGSLFQRVIDENQLDPARTLFLEDTAQHLVGARTVGLQTRRIYPGLDIRTLPLLDQPD
jgi:FMN phosphatase YigB (HAD superfamily)